MFNSVWMDFQNGLAKFQKWKLLPALTSAMAQVYAEGHLNSAGILQVENPHVLGFMINFTSKRAVTPIFIIALKLLITSSVSREFGFHAWYNLDELSCSTLWKRTLITVYHKWMHFPSCPLKLSQFASQNIWITDPMGKLGRSSLTAAQSTQLESRRGMTVQAFPRKTLQNQIINPAMACCKRHVRGQIWNPSSTCPNPHSETP